MSGCVGSLNITCCNTQVRSPLVQYFGAASFSWGRGEGNMSSMACEREGSKNQVFYSISKSWIQLWSAQWYKAHSMLWCTATVYNAAWFSNVIQGKFKNLQFHSHPQKSILFSERGSYLWGKTIQNPHTPITTDVYIDSGQEPCQSVSLSLNLFLLCIDTFLSLWI